MRRFVALGPAIVVMLAAVALMFVGPVIVRQMTHAAAVGRALGARQALDADNTLDVLDAAISRVSDAVSPSLVHIDVDAPRRESGRRSASSGAGWVWDAQGHIVTNAHVVRGATFIRVQTSDGRVTPAEILAADTYTDIAVLRPADPDGLLPIARASGQQPRIGQRVFAFGSPFGFKFSMSEGIISGLGRDPLADEPTGVTNYIQTDAAVNPGNSGGPLFNLDGEVIGVNSQIYSRSGGYQGLSFAVPIDVAMEVVDQLKTGGKVARGWLGVMIQEVTPELAQSFGLDKPRGALVGQVLADSPAQQAGVKAGDIIVAFNDQPVRHSSDLPLMVGRARPGTSASLTVIRDGKEQTLSAKIEQLPDEGKLQQAIAEPPARNRLGLTVTELPPDKRNRGSTGVLVKDVDEGPATSAGIRPGDIIARINNVDVSDVGQFTDLVKQLPTGRPVPVLVRRDNGALFLALTLPEEGKN